MLVLNKRAKTIIFAILFVLLAATGIAVEKYERDAFFKETVVTDNAEFVSSSADEIDGRININSANAEQLMALESIGEVRAERIIEYRTENGPFVTVEEIMKVAGINEKTFEDIQEYICAE